MLDATGKGAEPGPPPGYAPIQEAKDRDVNIPNVITVGRIFLVPLVVWLIIAGSMEAAFIVFVIAGISDALDGYLAKSFGWQSELGAYLDPVADKALLVSIYVTLGYFAHLPAWLVIAVVSRDLLIIGAVLLSLLLNRPVEVHPLLISKANTASQILLAAVVLGSLGFGLAPEGLIDLLIWVTGGLTILSAVAYLKTWVGHMAAYDAPHPKPEQKSDKPPYNRPGNTMPRRQKHLHGS